MTDKKIFKQEQGMPWVPEVGEFVAYSVASSDHPQMGICCGYQAWQSLDGTTHDVRFHVRIANPTKPNEQINMRNLKDLIKPTEGEVSAYLFFIAIESLIAEEDARKVSEHLASNGFGKVH